IGRWLHADTANKIPKHTPIERMADLRQPSPALTTGDGAVRLRPVQGDAGAQTWALGSAGAQHMEREQPVRVGPGRDRLATGARRQALEAGGLVLVGVLGMDGFAFGEAEAPVADRRALLAHADQVHLDAVLGLVVEGVMPEAVEIEAAVELAIDPA